MSKVDLAIAAVVALINLANALTEHWSKASGFRRVVLKATEFLSILSSKDSEKRIKLPGKVS